MIHLAWVVQMVHGKYITIEAARVWLLLPRRLSLDLDMDFCQVVTEI